MTTIAIPPIASETLLKIGSFDVRNTMLMAWLAMLVLIIVVVTQRVRGYKLVPGKFQNFIEIIVEGIFDFCNGIMQDAEESKRLLPLIATIFLFLIMGNWMGILPGIGSITVNSVQDGQTVAVPIFRSMNADVNMTLAIAIISFFCTEYLGIEKLGIVKYSSKFFVAFWKHPLQAVIGIMELISELSRLISFTFRLFGSIFAGEALLVVISFFVPFVAPLPFLGLEIFVGFIQAFIFAILTLAFIKIAVTDHSQASHA